MRNLRISKNRGLENRDENWTLRWFMVKIVCAGTSTWSFLMLVFLSFLSTCACGTNEIKKTVIFGYQLIRISKLLQI